MKQEMMGFWDAVASAGPYVCVCVCVCVCVFLVFLCLLLFVNLSALTGEIKISICKQSAPRSRQITTSTPRHSIFTGRMLFLAPNQQCESTEGK